MSSTPGKPDPTNRFQPFDPVDVLYGFDGPRVFTVRDAENELHLACRSDEDDDVCRYIVVPTTPAIVYELRSGAISILDALNQPTCLVCDVTHQGAIKVCRQIELEQIPRDALPAADTPLLPELESPVASRASHIPRYSNVARRRSK